MFWVSKRMRPAVAGSLGVLFSLVLTSTTARGQDSSALSAKTTPALQPAQEPQADSRASYVLGPDDQISIRCTDAEDIADKPIRIDTDGYIRVPMAGRLKAADLTVQELESELVKRLKRYFLKPEVVVTVLEFRSQPVSVIGAVKNPGIHQLEGRKTLVEILSLAGGLTDFAGSTVTVTRRVDRGKIPVSNATTDVTGQFSVAQLKLRDILQAKDPEQNILILPEDVISVPKAEMVYVVGHVMKAGGFVLNEKESMSVLQALSLAGGLDPSASPQNSRILRSGSNADGRVEMTVDLKKILSGKGGDVPLRPDDILFVPSSVPKKAAVRALESAVQIGTGLVIFRR